MNATRTATVIVALSILAWFWLMVDARAQRGGDAFAPGSRVLLDAHNAYPENGRFADRLDLALSTGLPLAIEQDLAWYRDRATGVARSIVSHGPPYTGNEPGLDEYFFSRIRPLMEQALRENRRERWPLITLNLDFKTDEPEHHAAVWSLLGRYEPWLTTARRTASAGEIDDLRVGPLLVLTGEADAQERSFHDRVPVGGTLRLFGAVHSRLAQAGTPAERRVKGGEELPDVAPFPKSNYRRWWNHPWAVVELGGQVKAGDWTPADQSRLERVVSTAHDAGLWIRFYTLDGFDPADTSHGWTPGYNFGSAAAARRRWEAAIRARVDFVAVDQYEAFADVARASRVDVEITGDLSHADYERLFEREFDVPAGTRRIDIELAYDERERTVIDLGVKGPGGIRGWAGGGPQRVFVAEHTASFGYTPGPITPGRWSVVIGVPNIRERVKASYTIRIRFSAGDAAWPVLESRARWYVGDFHAHSGHSDGRTSGPDGSRLRVPPHHLFDAASRAGLDFVTLSDHNTASHWADVDRLQPLYPRLLLLHAREITTYRGHMNAFGESRFVDFRLTPGRAVRDLAGELRAAGAFVSINHPERPDDESCMGCGWNDRDDATLRQVDAVEIVNGDAADEPSGWSVWAEMLTRGHRVVPIGGSDEHTPDEIADRRVGVPATVVFAQELSERALLQGLKAGRVYVRTRGLTGPELDFHAVRGADRAAMGEAVAAGPLVLHVATSAAAGQSISWIRNGAVVATTALAADGSASTRLEGRPGDWVSVILRDERGPTVFSNAIHVR